MNNTWIVVADSSGARIFSSDSKLTEANLCETLEHPESRLKDTELASDDRGRTRARDNNGSRASAMTHPTTPHDAEAEKFARELANRLRLANAKNQFAELILVAPPQFLGRLRGELDETTSARTRATVDRNYTQERPEMVLERIRELVD